MGVGPTVGPITGGLCYLCFLVRSRPSNFNYVLFSILFWLGHVGPFPCNLGIMDILYTFLPKTLYSLNIHVCDVLLIEVVQSVGRYNNYSFIYMLQCEICIVKLYH